MTLKYIQKILRAGIRQIDFDLRFQEDDDPAKTRALASSIELTKLCTQFLELIDTNCQEKKAYLTLQEQIDTLSGAGCDGSLYHEVLLVTETYIKTYLT